MSVGVEFQLLIWGAFWLDNGVAFEKDAALSEAGHAEWDLDQDYLDLLDFHVDGKKVSTPSYWALPAVATLLLIDEELADQTLSHESEKGQNGD